MPVELTDAQRGGRRAYVAVRWYVPSVSDMQALRAEKPQIEVSIADLEQRGAKYRSVTTGPAGGYAWRWMTTQHL